MTILLTETDPLFERTYEPARLLGRAIETYYFHDAEVAALQDSPTGNEQLLDFSERQLAKAKRRFNRRVSEFIRAARPPR